MNRLKVVVGEMSLDDALAVPTSERKTLTYDDTFSPQVGDFVTARIGNMLRTTTVVELGADLTFNAYPIVNHIPRSVEPQVQMSLPLDTRKDSFPLTTAERFSVIRWLRAQYDAGRTWKTYQALAEDTHETVFKKSRIYTISHQTTVFNTIKNLTVDDGRFDFTRLKKSVAKPKKPQVSRVDNIPAEMRALMQDMAVIKEQLAKLISASGL